MWIINIYQKCHVELILYVSVQAVNKKIQEILEKLHSLGGEDVMNALRERHLPPATENFLLHLATAEGLVLT